MLHQAERPSNVRTIGAGARSTQQRPHAGLSWPMEHDLELMVPRQRDSMVVAPMVPKVGAEVADLECAPSAEEMVSTEGQAPAAVVSARRMQHLTQ